MTLSPNLIHALKASAELEILVSITNVGDYSQTWTDGYTAILKGVTSIIHKLEPAYGKANVSKLDIEFIDREEWKAIIADYYIKNKRITIKIGPRDGIIGSFYIYFTGIVTDFAIDDERLILEVQDDLYVTKTKVPTENDTKTQSLAFQAQNPLDIKSTLLETYAEVPAARINSTEIDSERDTWFLNWQFERVLTDPVAIKELINELDEQTLCPTFADGDQITNKAFAPPMPGETLLELTDEWLRGTLKIEGRMEENFYNRCVVYYDWDESGSENEENFDNVIIVADTASQGADQWDEVKSKEIKSKWIRTKTITQPSNITGVVIYHVNSQNEAGTGTLAYNNTNKTLTWTSPGDSAGVAVNIDKDGKFQLFSNIDRIYIRVVVTHASLPGSDQNDSLTVSNLAGSTYATFLASHYVTRYTNPQAELSFDLALSDAIHLGEFLRVSDILKITSERIVTKGKLGWDEERVFLTSVRPDFATKKIRMTALQTSFKKRYGFISPSTVTNDYDAATDTEREYAFIGDASNYVGSANDDGYYIY